MTPSSVPARKWSSNPWLVTAVITLAMLLLVWVRNDACSNPPQELPYIVSDGAEYFKMAQGDTRDVMAPFTRRALYPFLARCLTQVTGVSLQLSFILLTVVSLFLLVYALAKILLLFDLSPWIVAIFILTPFTIERVEYGSMPDLLHAALTAIFFLLVLRKKYLSGLIILIIAYMTRENTLVLCLVFGVFAWLRNLRSSAIGSGVVILIGTAFGSWCVRLGQPNASHLSDFLYFGLKVPFNFMKNVLGLRIWTNTLQFGEPFAKFNLPHFLRAGDVRVVGICYPEWALPLFTLITLLTLFGTGPLIVWHGRHLKLWSKLHPLGIQVVFVYGVISFLLGTAIGDWVDRLIGYGWPLFCIGVPYILAVMKQHHADLPLKLSLLSLWIVAWIPVVTGYSRYTSFLIGVLTLFAAVLAYGLTWRLLRDNKLVFDPSQPVIHEA